MNISRRAGGMLKYAALWMGAGMAAMCIGLAGFGFLITGLFILLAHHFSEEAAAAITGCVLIFVALFVFVMVTGLLKRARARQPSLLSEFGGTISLAGRVIGMMVRRDPRKAIFLSIIAGALAEYVTADRKREK